MADHDQAAAISSGDVEPIVQSSRNFRPSSFTRDGILSKLPNVIKGVRRPAGVQSVCRRSVPQAKFNHLLSTSPMQSSSCSTNAPWRRALPRVRAGSGGSWLMAEAEVVHD
jgi:hypothetical protein